MELNTSNTIVDNQSLRKTTSYQNCTEADLVGYNDCPTFLVSSTSNKEGRVSSSLKHKQALRGASILSANSFQNLLKRESLPLKISDSQKEVTNDDLIRNDDTLSSEEINLIIQERIEKNEKRLSANEFSFYKAKVLKQLDKFSTNDRYLKNLCDIFLISSDCSNTKALVQNWVSKEPQVGSWLIPLSKII